MPTGHTAVVGVVGNPVGHSLSPVIHNAAFEAMGLDWVYVAFPVVDGGRAVEAMRTLGLRGLSVTMPHKQAVAGTADFRTEPVERLGVANTLFLDADGRVGADSTDGDGFVAAYRASFGRSLEGLTVGVIGAGGAARAIIEAAGRNGADAVLVANRSADRAGSAASLTPAGRVVEPVDLAEADVIVNATSVGMAGGPAPDENPVPAGVLRSGHDVVDIVYSPRVTPLLAEAEAIGAGRSDGLGMLIHQAALQFERWTGRPAPVETMIEAAERRL